MDEGLWVIWGLATIIGCVLMLPFMVKKVEEELEIFLFIMGVISVSVSRLWNWHLVKEALVDPIKISMAVLYFWPNKQADAESGTRVIVGTVARIIAVSPDSNTAKSCVEASQ